MQSSMYMHIYMYMYHNMINIVRCLLIFLVLIQQLQFLFMKILGLFLTLREYCIAHP